jgi:TP901 family phage tail tape measure protein
MADDTIKVRLILDDGALDKTAKKSKSVGVNIGKSISSGITTALGGLATLAGAALALKKVATDFIQFERALAGVAKTTDITGPALDRLGSDLQQLSTEIPVTANELLRLSQVAGQFGVRGTDNILKFAETVGKLQFAIEGIDPEQAAQNLTRILNVTGAGVKNIDKLSSALVALGNNFEATEGEILTVGNEVVRATAQFGVSAQEALGLGAALKAVGARAEGSGTAVGKAFRKISEAITENGTKLKNFADVIGISSDELKKRFGDDAIGVFEDLVKGLNKTAGGATGLGAKLKQLGLNQDRTLKSLVPLILANEKLSGALDLSREAYDENVALNIEFGRVNATTEAKVLRLKNEVIRLSTTLGQTLGPIIRDNIDFLTDLARGFTNLVKSISGTELQKVTVEIDRVNTSLRNLESQQQDLLAGGKGLDGFFLDTDKAAADLQPKIDALAEKYSKLIARQKELQDAGGDGGAAAVARADAFVAALAAQEAAMSSVVSGLPEKTAGVQEALGASFETFGQIITGSFDAFSVAISDLSELTDEQVDDINKAINQKLAAGISRGVQTFVGALAAGENAFKALGKSILGLAGDLAIQVGTMLIALGISQTAALASPGGPVIAAGLGLVAIGTILKAIGGNGFAGGGAAGAPAGGASTVESGGVDTFEQEKLQEPQTIVNVAIDGVVTDATGVAQQISELLSDFSESNGGFVVNEV